MHILSAKQFLNKKKLEALFARAAELEALAARDKLPPLLRGKILATLFYEPSTRTRLSFEAAMLRLGGEILSSESAGQFSSAIKGETIEDTIRIVGSYADAIAIRHPERGAAARAAAAATVPIINAGDGHGEHPTQALLDCWTIHKELGGLAGRKVVFVGDLRYGRTVHSLSQLLTVYRAKMTFVSPVSLRLPEEYRKALKAARVKFRETENLEAVLGGADVVYMTRVQKERFLSPEDYAAVKGRYVLDRAALKKMKKKAIIMHPLPRVDEVAKEADADPRAAYFRQAKNGLYIRMALLESVLTRK